ncbi:bifunctional GNAT family N-acetyltransferase/thioesterase [Gayadomonas joobiniege]|uniref:bifunctional GNAT family N-acetyltransferase/hotdog fold thioesterase n=1 Tax=Gayadomonas joobiniege TaxID=1234606 RepID=UPI00037A18F9|nr:bifunctional GNAT family N-acetyltransferase/thioesterase [Gayadomonas joobiniege]
MYQIITPKTEQELEKYYHLRWQMLKEPFGFPPGSEKDEYDSLAEHRMVYGSDGRVLAVGRVHFVSQDEAQIRHVAVCSNCRGKGLGSLIMTTLEQVARAQNAKRVITFSRADSVAFFEHCGYQVIDNPIIDIPGGQPSNRRQMVKKLSEFDGILRHPLWCKELQETWLNKIPITQAMGIKVFQYTGAQFEVRAALNANINMHKTMFAGSIYSMATLAGWGMVHLLLKETSLRGSIVLGKGEISYRKAITKHPIAKVHLNNIEGELAPLRKGKKARLRLQVCLYDDARKCGDFFGEYYILPEQASDDLLAESHPPAP